MFFKHRSTITPKTAFYAMMLLSAMAPIIRAHGGGQHSSNRQQSRPTKKKADNFRLPVGELNLADRPMLPPHGGQITTTKFHYIEVVYSPKETRFYLYSQSQRPISMRGIRGEIVMQVNGNSQVFRYPITNVVKPIWTGDKGYLSTAVDLSRVRDGDMQVTIDLKNIPSGKEPSVRFSQTFALSQPRLQVSIASMLQADRALVSQQRICPVTETLLGEHGAPIKIFIDRQPIYVCCKGCIQQVYNHPRAYLQKSTMTGRTNRPAQRRSHVLVSYAKAEDRPAVQAQEICPVMDKPLNGHGTPIKILINGQPLFVCCKGCVGKVEKDPSFYLSKANQHSRHRRFTSR